VQYFDYPIDGGFYYYEKDPDTGLNREVPVKTADQLPDVKIGGSYGFSRFFHRFMYEPGKNLYGFMKKLCGKIQGTKMEGPFHKIEHLTKVALFDCRDCGDCALIDVAYLCPMSQCPKNQRNGACGGSYKGWCEVYPGKRHCVYVRAYARLKKYNEEGQLSGEIVPPCNWDLYQTSSWINYYQGKDHTSQKFSNKSS
jgi:methylenetetrahydrofolate reductase (NADPH)